MRMWKVNPKNMCRQHLLGEHCELHMFVGHINSGKSLKGFLDNGLVETGYITTRHDELVSEMFKRSMNHYSPIQENNYPAEGFVDIYKSEQELKNRCSNCRRIMDNEN